MRASRSKRASRSGSAGEQRGQDLDRDVAAELGIARAVDLAHAARAQQRMDPKGTQLPADQRVSG